MPMKEAFNLNSGTQNWKRINFKYAIIIITSKVDALQYSCRAIVNIKPFYIHISSSNKKEVNIAAVSSKIRTPNFIHKIHSCGPYGAQSQQHLFIYLNKISWLVFRKEMDCVFCEVKLKNNQVFKDAPSTSDFPSESHHHFSIFLLLWTLRVLASEEQVCEGWETFQESNAIPHIGEHFIRIVQYAVHYRMVTVEH